MLGKLYQLASIVSIATLLACGGFGAFLYGTGRVNAERTEQMAAILRGEEMAPVAPPTQPAEGDGAASGPAGARAAEEVHEAQEFEHLQNLRIERAMADLAAQRELLEHATLALMQKQEQQDERQASLAAQREQLESAALEEGFQQELEYIGGLQPGQAKDHLVYVFQKHPEDAVRILRALDVGRGKRILAQMKSPEELQIMSQLLERLRLLNPENDADESGTTAGAPSP